MNHTIRQMRELRSLDQSNHTLRFNRTRKEAGMYGDMDDDAPTGAAIVWGLGAFAVTLLVLLVVLR